MAILPPFFLDTVVALGVNRDPKKRRWIGTGFIFGRFIENIEENEEKRYRLWLITNKHVLADLKEVCIKFNSASEPKSKDYWVALKARNGRPHWVGHPEEKVDVAAIFLNADFLRTEKRRFTYFQSDVHIIEKKEMQDMGLTEGDRVFVLGFPMGLVSHERQYVICREGCIARIRDFLENLAPDFLVDATVFPGNSGGPVVTCPAMFSIQGTKAIPKSSLIGIVKSYIPYFDYAVSQQTLLPRIRFEENSGLAAVDSVDSIIETVNLADKRFKSRFAQRRYRTKKLREQNSIELDNPVNDSE